MSVDQAFHTPSFGDEEFEFPSLGPNGRCGARGVFGNQVPVEYLKRKLSCDQIYVYFPKRDNNQTDCQIYNNHSLSNQPLLHQQAYPSPASAMSGNNQYHHQSGEAYQQDMMHSINMQLQSFDNHSTYLSNGSVQQMQRPQVTMMPQSQLMGPPQQIFSTISQSQMSSQLGLQIGMGQTPHHQGAGSIGSSPPGSNHNSPGLETSEDSDDSTPLAQLIGTMKRPSPEPLDTSVALTKATKKPKAQKKKKKRDPNEPQKPVSAYALFFRDTQAAIKGQNPNASFGEVSKIVASMWDALDVDHKNGYKKRTETAKKEYLKALAAYRATLVSKAAVDQSDAIYGNSPPNQNSPTNSIDRMMQKVSPVLTSVVDAIQPVANAMGLHQRPAVHNQQAWHMQSPPHMSNNNGSPPQMMQSNAMMQQQQMVMNSSGSHQMTAHSPQMGHSPSDSPTCGQNTLSAPSGGGMLSTSADAMQQCLRNGCSNPAIDNPDWDREYCSSECVVSHCKDVFATWVAQRQGIPTAYSTVK